MATVRQAWIGRIVDERIEGGQKYGKKARHKD